MLSRPDTRAANIPVSETMIPPTTLTLFEVHAGLLLLLPPQTQVSGMDRKPRFLCLLFIVAG